MQSGTFHIAFTLFFIFHKPSSMRIPNLMNILPHRASFVKDGKNEEAKCKVSICMPFLYTELFSLK